MSALVVLALTLAALAAGVWYWLTHRAQPEPTREVWCPGVHYERIVLQAPRPVVAHLVRIALDTPGLELVVTPPAISEAGEVLSAPTTRFAAEQGVQVAINASYFYPFRNEHPLDYEPHPGDPVHVLGVTAARGVRFGKPLEGAATLCVARDNRLTFSPCEPSWNAVSGMGFVLRDGALADFRVDDFTRVPYPRTLAASDAAGRVLLLLVIDGKQPGYSEGMTLAEAAELLRAAGGHTAIQLDGGGSATLVRAHELVSSPANFKVPGWERSVATHLGVRVHP